MPSPPDPGLSLPAVCLQQSSDIPAQVGTQQHAWPAPRQSSPGRARLFPAGKVWHSGSQRLSLTHSPSTAFYSLPKTFASFLGRGRLTPTECAGRAPSRASPICVPQNPLHWVARFPSSPSQQRKAGDAGQCAQDKQTGWESTRSETAAGNLQAHFQKVVKMINCLCHASYKHVGQLRGPASHLRKPAALLLTQFPANAPDAEGGPRTGGPVTHMGDPQPTPAVSAI